MKNAIKNCKKYFSCNYLEKIMDNSIKRFILCDWIIFNNLTDRRTRNIKKPIMIPNNV